MNFIKEFAENNLKLVLKCKFEDGFLFVIWERGAAIPGEIFFAQNFSNGSNTLYFGTLFLNKNEQRIERITRIVG